MHNIRKFARRLYYQVKEINEIKEKIKTPDYILAKQQQLDKEKLLIIEESIKTNYHKNWRNKNNYSEEEYNNDLDAHLLGRLTEDRQRIIPWLESVTSLNGLRVLEIGCGTGASTVALAEQGAIVTGIDVDEGALLVAKDRCNAYGLTADIYFMNATEIKTRFQQKFDLIIFFASLEHMTHNERIESLKNAWDLLHKDSYLAIIETPNRLWYYDGHSSLMSFFNWLPDDLAFDYTKYSKRSIFNDFSKNSYETSKNDFLRYGRCMSFHEIDLAIGDCSGLNIASCLHTFEKVKYSEYSKEKRFMDLLSDIAPNINKAFFYPSIDIVIKKT